MQRHAIRWIAPVVLIAALSAAAPPASAGFSIILERDGATWRATCESGCTWTALSGSKAGAFGSTVVIDNYGITLSARAGTDNAAFAFRLTADGDAGWTAAGLKGTAWTELTFGCRLATCRARITDTGVEGVP